LPTRNGGEFLENCILSILEQDHTDFELVISDNANTDATPTIIAKFADDPRVTTVRQSVTLSVSENWTAALLASKGDYVLMMGDDDYLLPGALGRLDKVLGQYKNPDCVIYNGYSYVAPRAIADNSASYWAPRHFGFGRDFSAEGVIEIGQRMDIVRDMFRFNTRIPLNMQTTLFSRRAIDRECAGVFRAPFPDHYLLNALLIKGDQWVYLPEQLVVVGVSAKSFGHYFYSHKADAGLAYLGISTHFPGALPGSALLNGMGAWLHDLKKTYPVELKGVTMDWHGYVRRQVYAWLMQHRHGGITTRELLQRFAALSLRQWVGLLVTAFDAESWKRLIRMLRIGNKSQVESQWHALKPLSDVANIREFAHWLERSSKQT